MRDVMPSHTFLVTTGLILVVLGLNLGWSSLWPDAIYVDYQIVGGIIFSALGIVSLLTAQLFVRK